MAAVKNFVCFAFESNVFRLLLSQCRPFSRCFCCHIQSKMEQLKRQVVWMSQTRGFHWQWIFFSSMVRVLAMGHCQFPHHIWETNAKSVTTTVLRLTFPSVIFQQAMGHHMAFVNLLLVNIFAWMLSVISDISHALCPLPVFLVIVILR